MAKQNVTMIERHLEKIIIGAAGAVVLVIFVLYVVGSPNAVEVDGRKLGPDQFYTEMRTRAEQARATMQQGQLDINPSAGIKVPDINQQRSPYDYLGLPKEFTVAFVPPAPDIPSIADEDRPDSIQLAKILPPRPLVATVGRAFARLPDSILVRPGSTGGDVQPPPPITQEYHWVALFSAVHRKEQRDEFERVRYAPDRQKLLVAVVEAERQVLLPTGAWSEPEMVTGYSPRKIPVRATVPLHRQDDGTYAILDADRQYIQDYLTLLDSPAGQEEILRPQFQEFLENRWFAWEVPKQLPGLSVQLADYGAMLPTEDEGPTPRRTVEPTAAPRTATPSRRTTGRDFGGGRGRFPGPDGAPPVAPRASVTPSPGDAPAARAGRAEITRLFREADEAITKQEFIQARDLLEQVIQNPDASSKQVEDAQSRLLRIQQDVDRAERELFLAEERRRLAGEQDVGEDVDPFWLTDLRIIPGKTYRYRVRLLVFNQYVGLANRLENADDAGKVTLAGEWSEWSDPVQVQPVRYLFITKAANANTATLEIREWVRGEWKMGFGDRQVGELAAFSTGGDEFVYGAIVAGVNDQYTYQERSVGRDGAISYRERQTAAAILLTADGDVAEHVVARDAVLKRDLLSQIKKEQALREQLDEGPAGQIRPGVQPRLPSRDFAPRGRFPRGGPSGPGEI
ncbi:MAG: hypothetical protein GXY55_09100 [Phycisphaerae bacterium]|nr:hypothetical protein [Phycisphaerae bacterium]